MKGISYKYIYIDEAGTTPAIKSEFNSKCRICNHFSHSHNKIWGCGRPKSNPFSSVCQCQEYIPSDNLDYIEWLADKKGLI